MLLERTLRVSSRDANAAAKAQPLLRQLILTSVEILAHRAGVNLAGGGVSAQYAGGEVNLQRLGAAAAPAQRELLMSQVRLAAATGLFDLEQLGRMAGNLRSKALCPAGANITTAYGGPGDTPLDAFEAGCAELGAGPMQGLTGYKPELIKLCWPGTAPLIAACEAAGIQPNSMYTRWQRMYRGNKQGDRSRATQEGLAALPRGFKRRV